MCQKQRQRVAMRSPPGMDINLRHAEYIHQPERFAASASSGCQLYFGKTTAQPQSQRRQIKAGKDEVRSHELAT